MRQIQSEATQPRSSDDDVVMRDFAEGHLCSERWHIEQTCDADMPPEFEGPHVR